MASARSVLLLGASGLLGAALAQALGARVAARTYLSRAIEGGVRFDARSSPLSGLVGGLRQRPDAAVILLGVTRIDDCACDPAGTAQTNVEGVIRVARELSAMGIAPLFVSSDAVFDGGRSYWTEDDEPRPILAYGRQKLEAERFMASLKAPWIIVRPPKLLSPTPDERCMLTDWVHRLGGSKPIECATDQYFTPAAAPDAAQAIIALLEQGAQGLYHVCGPERLSRRTLLQAVVDEYRNFAEPLAEIVECSLRDIKVAEPRPLDASMRSARIQSLNLPRMRAASDVARELVRNYFSGRQAR